MILDSTIDELLKDPSRVFTYAEIKLFTIGTGDKPKTREQKSKCLSKKEDLNSSIEDGVILILQVQVFKKIT